MTGRIRFWGWPRLGLDGPAHAAPLALLLILESALVRGVMLSRAGALLSAFDVLRALKSDVLPVLGMYLIFSAVIAASRGGLRASLIILYDGLIITWLAALAVHAGLFLYFGTGLSRTYVEHWLQNFKEASALVLNEIRGANVLWLLLQAAAVAACIALPRLKRIKLWTAAASERRTKSLLVSSLAVLIVLEAYMFVPALAGVHPAITANPLRMLLARDAKSRAGAAAVPAEFAIDGPLEIDKDPARPPLNVVLVIFESLGWKNSDLFKPGIGTTPFVKSLAEKGMTVRRLYSVLPHTSKALVSLLGGVYPYLEPEVKEALPGILPERGLAHILRKQGYRTAFFQTANNYENRSELIANLGFELFKGVTDLPDRGFSVTNYFGKEERMMLQPCLDWVDSVRRGPFFLTLLTLSTHHDYNVPASFAKKDYGVRDPNYGKYLNAVRYTDGFIQDVFGALESRGLLGNTLFIVTGDHGEAFEEHRGLRGHNTALYEEGLRTAAVLYAPGRLPAGTTIEGYRSILDIVPTVCDVLGLRVRAGRFAGQSLLSPVPEDRTLYFSAWSQGYGLAVRHGAAKFLFWGIPDRTEAYENEADPEDKTDLGRGNPSARPRLQAEEAAAEKWADAVCFQYLEREKSLSRGGVAAAPAPLANRLRAVWDEAVAMTGFEMYPRERPPATSLWIKVAFQAEKLPKKALEFCAHITHENGASDTRLLAGAEALGFDKLKPGAYVTRDMFLVIPSGWPPGEARVEVGFRDKRSGGLLRAAGETGPGGAGGWVSLGKITITVPY